MPYCDKSALSSYEKWSSLAQFAAGQIGKAVGGRYGSAFGVYLTGKNTWVARTADLFDRIDKGTARPVDYAEVASSTATLLATFGVLTGLAAPAYLTAATVAGVALTAYKFYQDYQHGCYDGIFDEYKNLNRDGKYHVYDPLVLDLDGDGVINDGSELFSDSYTLSDGTTREMGDLLLAADHLHSRYADPIELTEEQMQAANVQGIGRLRDLREAAALSPKLAEVQSFFQIFLQGFHKIQPLADTMRPSERVFQTAFSFAN